MDKTHVKSSKSIIIALLIGGLFLFALIGNMINGGINAHNASAKMDSTKAGTGDSPSQTIDKEYESNYQAGNSKGRQEGANWAKKGWEIPLPLGVSAMAATRAADIKTSKPEAWKQGFEKGFHDGYTSIRPITRKEQDYDQLSWSNAQPGVKLYNYSERQEGTIVSAARSSGLITVKFRNGTIEDKLLEGVAGVWFVRKADAATSSSLDVNPYAQGQDNELLTRLVIKPFLKSLLSDPDSLQDLRFVRSSAVKRQRNTYKVTLFYRAKNGFGALTGYQQTFTIRNQGAGEAALEDWRVSL